MLYVWKRSGMVPPVSDHHVTQSQLPRDDGKGNVRGSFPIHEDGIRCDAGPQPEPLGFARVRVQIEMGKIAA